MLTPNVLDFPNNVISLIATRAHTFIDPDLYISLRPLRPTDPMQSLAVFPATSLPDQQSKEIGSNIPLNPIGPTLKTYNLVLQSMVINTIEEDAIAVHSQLAQLIWRMLYTDSPLALGLTALYITTNNIRERFQRSGINIVRYLSNEVEGKFIQTSWTEYWFETETVRTS